MKIKKLGHCCLLVTLPNIAGRDGKSLNILTDPGSFSTAQNDVKEIDIVLITHEHADHLHTESLKTVLANNTGAQVYTNSGVGAKLDAAGIAYHPLEGTDVKEFDGSCSGLTVRAFDCRHEELFEDFGQVQNTGYLISASGRNLFYPGDAYCKPEIEVDVLALPVSGGWCRISDAVSYAIEIKPKKTFPVHDGMMYPDRIGGPHAVPAKFLPLHGIEFVPMADGDEKEF